MLKTISTDEMEVFLPILEDYFWYMSDHQDSLIAKILGVYKFTGFDTGPINFILMKSILKVPKQQVCRIYDLKGSTFDREVLKQDSEIEEHISKVLKDRDFQRLEVNMGIEDREKILNQLERDTIFLKQHRLMDYSLVVFKVDWINYVEGKTMEQVRKVTKGLQHCYEGRDGYYYHMGVIDYFQTYSNTKKMERLAKKVINMNIKLDTSSQNPTKYQARFMNFMQMIT